MEFFKKLQSLQNSNLKGFPLKGKLNDPNSLFFKNQIFHYMDLGN